MTLYVHCGTYDVRVAFLTVLCLTENSLFCVMIQLDLKVSSMLCVFSVAVFWIMAESCLFCFQMEAYQCVIHTLG